jgi:hypothetical protein
LIWDCNFQGEKKRGNFVAIQKLCEQWHGWQQRAMRKKGEKGEKGEKRSSENILDKHDFNNTIHNSIV